MDTKSVEDRDVASKRKTLHGSAFVFPATCLLAAASVTGPIIAVAVYINQPINLGVDVCQILLVAASAISFVYIGFFFLAARRNEPVGSVRPPVRQMHHACFVTLRINIILWGSAIIAAMVLAPKNACMDTESLCTMQKAEIWITVLAFVDVIIILSLLEKCNTPFQTPQILRLLPNNVTPVNLSADDLLLDRSISRRQSLENEKCLEKGDPAKGISASKTEPGYDSLQLSTVKYDSSFSERTLSLRYPKTRIDSWGIDWMHLETEGELSSDPVLPKYKYTNSISSSSSSYVSETSDLETTDSSSSISSDSCSSISARSNSRKPRKAAPSSSISNSSYRSPLSVMRTADQPEVPVHLNLRIFSRSPGPTDTPSHEHKRNQRQPSRQKSRRRHGSSPAAQSMSRYALRQAASALSPPPLVINKSTSPFSVPPRYTYIAPVFSPAVKPIPFRRRSTDVQITEIWTANKPSSNSGPISMEDMIEAHMQKIERGVAARTKAREIEQMGLEESILAEVRMLEMEKVKGLGLNIEFTGDCWKRPGTASTDKTLVEEFPDTVNEKVDNEIERRADVRRRKVRESCYIFVPEKSPSIPELNLEPRTLLWDGYMTG